MPKARRISVVLLLFGAVAIASATAATPVAVKASTRNEVSPAAELGWFAWAKSRENRASPFDVWAQRDSGRPFKVNPRGTQAYPGGISGGRLVYQQIVGIDSGDLRLYDLERRRHLRLPAGVNTQRWECCASLSGSRLLFTRGSPETLDVQTVVLRDLVTGENRVLDRLRNVRGVLSAGQVNGNFAVWSRCNPHPRCQIRRHDITTKRTTTLPSPAVKVVYSPSVNPNGTTYYIRSNRGCGKSVELVKASVLGGVQVLTALPGGYDVDVTHAYFVVGKSPEPTTTTRVFYDRVRCGRETWDIFRVDDVERLPERATSTSS